MKELLHELNRHSGVRGSAVVTKDGMIVAAALPKDASEEVVSALVSFLLSTTNQSLHEAGMPNFENLVLTATHGRILLLGAGEVYLVVVTDQFANLDLVMVDAHATAGRILKASKINV